MTAVQPSLFETARPLKPSCQEVLEALRWCCVASSTAQIQSALAEHGISRERSVIAKRLCELEERGLVERVGKEYDTRGVSRTTWRRR